jgi:serine/threonine protein kinase
MTTLPTTHANSRSRYSLREQIAVGGTAAVHRGVVEEGPHVGDIVAVKVLHELAPSDVDERIARELALAHRLQGVGGVAEIVDVTVMDGRVAIVSPLYDSTVADRIASLGSLPVREVVDVGAAVARVLHLVHERDVVHGDVKPSNVFLRRRADGSNEVILGDFGVAVFIDEHTWVGARAMSLPYAAPELLDGASASTASDVYALGATLHHLFTGDPPFVDGPGQDRSTAAGLATLVRRVADEDPPRIERADVPRALALLIEQMLAKDPAARPRDAHEIARRLTAIEQQPGDAPARRAPRRRRLIALGAAAACALAVGAAMQRGDDSTRTPALEAVARPIDSPTAATTAATTAPTTAPTTAAIVSSTSPATSPTTITLPTTSTRATNPTTSMPVTQSPVQTSDSTTPTSTAPSTAAPSTTPAPPSSAATTTQPAGPCGNASALVCDDFTLDAGDWSLLEDPRVATIDVSGAVSFRPVIDGVEGASFARQRVALPNGSTTTTLSARVRFGAHGGGEWFMNVMSIVNDGDAVWNIDARPGDAGAIVMTTYHQDQPGNFAEDLRGVTLQPDRWYCVAFSVTPSAPVAVRITLDGAEVASVPGPLAAQLTPVMGVSFGPAWVSPAALAPALTVDDVRVAAGSQPSTGCSSTVT